MTSRICAALIADMVAQDRGATYRQPTHKVDKPKRRTRRFKKPQID